eukprot:3991019-Pleurochrysis_carterae.AAC.4
MTLSPCDARHAQCTVALPSRNTLLAAHACARRGGHARQSAALVADAVCCHCECYRCLSRPPRFALGAAQNNVEIYIKSVTLISAVRRALAIPPRIPVPGAVAAVALPFMETRPSSGLAAVLHCLFSRTTLCGPEIVLFRCHA